MEAGFSEEVIRRLRKRYGDYSEELLQHNNTTQLLVAAILSPQCTDKQVNSTTKDLFKKFTNIEDYANTDAKTLMKELKGINYYKTKARHVREAAKIIVERFNGKIPK